MILYPRGSRPATTCSALFRILVGVALTAELANSLASEEEPDGRDTGPSGSAGKGEELANNAGLYLRSRDFDLTYTVPKTAIDDDDELIARARKDKIFLTPEEWDAKENGQRGDNTHGNRIGLSNIPEPKVKPICEHSLICDEVESYPLEDMEKIAQNLGSLSALASHVSNKVPVNRMGDGGNSNRYKSLCNSTMQVHRPKSMRKDNYKASWQHVLNTKSFVQEFYVTVCEEKDSPCKISGVSLNAPSMYGAGSACRQQYVERRVVVVDNDSAKPYVDLFPIPSSCCCHKTGLNVPKSRFGGNSDNRLRRQSRDE